MKEDNKIREIDTMLFQGSYSLEYLVKSYGTLIVELLLDIRKQNDTKSTK